MEGDSTYDRKRKEICGTALELFAERGFEGATLEAVADALGYTKPALYYYFKSKEKSCMPLGGPLVRARLAGR